MDATHDALFDRLHAEDAKWKAQRAAEEAKRRVEELRDAASGKPLFAPSIGRGPIAAYDRNPEALPVGEYLFAARNDFADARERRVLEREYAVKARRKSGFVSERSMAIIEQRQRDGLALIWSELLAAHGEVLSGDAERGPLLDVRRAHSSSSARARGANGAALGVAVAERVDDVLAYLVDAKASPAGAKAEGAEGGDRSGDGKSDLARGFVGRDEFIEVASFFTGLVPRHFSSAEPAPAPSFAPQINASSRRLAERRAEKREAARAAARVAAGAAEGSHRRRSAIDVLYEDGKRNSDHKEAKRRELEESLQSECTFSPKLNIGSRPPPPPPPGAAADASGADVVRALPARRRNKTTEPSTSFRRGSFFGYRASVAATRASKCGGAKQLQKVKQRTAKAKQPLPQQPPKRGGVGSDVRTAEICAVPRTPLPAKRAPQPKRETAHPGAAAAESILDQLEQATNTLLRSTR